jgi:hypothetical protein
MSSRASTLLRDAHISERAADPGMPDFSDQAVDLARQCTRGDRHLNHGKAWCGCPRAPVKHVVYAPPSYTELAG